MKLSFMLFLPAYHNVTDHILLVYEAILRVQNSWRILISSQNKNKRTTQGLVNYPCSSLQCTPSSVHYCILNLNSKCTYWRIFDQSDMPWSRQFAKFWNHHNFIIFVLSHQSLFTHLTAQLSHLLRQCLSMYSNRYCKRCKTVISGNTLLTDRNIIEYHVTF